jgi:hypothetical protein
MFYFYLNYALIKLKNKLILISTIKMKGVKTMSLANGTAKRFQSDDISSKNIVVSNTLMVAGHDVAAVLDMLLNRVKELEDKVASFETVEN